jgi:hypothetical protein
LSARPEKKDKKKNQQFCSRVTINHFETYLDLDGQLTSNLKFSFCIYFNKNNRLCQKNEHLKPLWLQNKPLKWDCSWGWFRCWREMIQGVLMGSSFKKNICW